SSPVIAGFPSGPPIGVAWTNGSDSTGSVFLSDCNLNFIPGTPCFFTNSQGGCFFGDIAGPPAWTGPGDLRGISHFGAIPMDFKFGLACRGHHPLSRIPRSSVMNAIVELPVSRKMILTVDPSCDNFSMLSVLLKFLGWLRCSEAIVLQG